MRNFDNKVASAWKKFHVIFLLLSLCMKKVTSLQNSQDCYSKLVFSRLNMYFKQHLFVGQDFTYYIIYESCCCLRSTSAPLKTSFCWMLPWVWYLISPFKGLCCSLLTFWLKKPVKVIENGVCQLILPKNLDSLSLSHTHTYTHPHPHTHTDQSAAE